MATAFRALGAEWCGASRPKGRRVAPALAAGAPVPITQTSIATTLGAPQVSALALAHVQTLVKNVFVVSDADAVRGTLTLVEEARV